MQSLFLEFNLWRRENGLLLLVALGCHSFFGYVVLQKAQDIGSRGTRSIVMIGIIFINISVIRDSFDHQPTHVRESTHHCTEGGPFHVNSHCSAHWCLDVLERGIAVNSTS